MIDKKKPSPPNENKADNKQSVANIVGIVICVLLIPILIINCTLIIKSLIYEDEVPSFGGRIPLIVLTESMEPDIMAGDLIICRVPSAEDLDAIVPEETVISFFDPTSKGNSIVTHKVKEIEIKDGKRYYRTYGINNNSPDRVLVPEENIVGIYTGVSLGGLGHVAMFMQSTAGLIICIFVPLAALITFEILHRKKQDKAKDTDIEALMAELQALKSAQQTKADGADGSDKEETDKE